MGASVKDFLVWTLFMAGAAAIGTMVLRLGLHLSWSDLLIPVGCFMALQTAFYGGILRIRRYKNMQFAFVLVAVYIWAFGVLAGYYLGRWGLVEGIGRSDLWWFTGIMGAIALAGALMPRRWTEGYLSAGIKCARCGHYHEGHDCRCGCQADQFKYANFQPPV